MTAPACECPPSRTDRILAAVSRTLAERRGEIDAEAPLSSVTVVVQIDQRSGRVRRVTYRTESVADFGDERRRGAA